jgi:hypothetical protein
MVSESLCGPQKETHTTSPKKQCLLIFFCFILFSYSSPLELGLGIGSELELGLGFSSISSLCSFSSLKFMIPFLVFSLVFVVFIFNIIRDRFEYQ